MKRSSGKLMSDRKARKLAGARAPESRTFGREEISRWGYEPEDSLGFCPSFANNSIYFAWRKR